MSGLTWERDLWLLATKKMWEGIDRRERIIKFNPIKKLIVEWGNKNQKRGDEKNQKRDRGPKLIKIGIDGLVLGKEERKTSKILRLKKRKRGKRTVEKIEHVGGFIQIINQYGKSERVVTFKGNPSIWRKEVRRDLSQKREKRKSLERDCRVIITIYLI